MGVETDDLIRITDKQTYLGQEVLNVYYYRYVVGAPVLDEVYDTIAGWWSDFVLDPVRETQNQFVMHTTLKIENMTGGADIREYTINKPGTLTCTAAQCLPANMTVGYILHRNNRNTRNGYKRFSGLTDNLVVGDSYVRFDETAISNLEEALAKPINLGIVEAFFPVIVKHPVGTPPLSHYAYSGVLNAQLVGLGTQNSRKSTGRTVPIP